MTDRMCKATAAALLTAGIVLLLAASVVHTPGLKRPASIPMVESSQVAKVS